MGKEKKQGIDELVASFEKKMAHYRWLQGIAVYYAKQIEIIEANEESYKGTAVFYHTSLVDSDRMDFNMGYPMKAEYVKAGIRDALESVNKDLEVCSNEIKEVLCEIHDVVKEGE